MSYRTVDGSATTSDNDDVAKTGTPTFAPARATQAGRLPTCRALVP